MWTVWLIIVCSKLDIATGQQAWNVLKGVFIVTWTLLPLPTPYLFQTLSSFLHHTHIHMYMCSKEVWSRDYRVFLLARHSCWQHQDPPVSQHYHHDQQNLQSVWCVGECGPHSLYLIHLHQHCEFQYCFTWKNWPSFITEEKNVDNFTYYIATKTTTLFW